MTAIYNFTAKLSGGGPAAVSKQKGMPSFREHPFFEARQNTPGYFTSSL